MGEKVYELALFAGLGGGILGGQRLGWKTVCAVELDAYCAAVLADKQNRHDIDIFPIWSDVRTFDGHPWRGLVDVVSGGFPCQDISVAGNGAGIEGASSRLWFEMARIVSEVRPPFVFVENSPMLIHRGLKTILEQFAAMGYDARWGIVSAENSGAFHTRERIWIVAYTDIHGSETSGNGRISHKDAQQQAQPITPPFTIPSYDRPVYEQNLAPVDRMVDGLPNWLEQIGGLGNAQVPQAVELAWKTLIED